MAGVTMLGKERSHFALEKIPSTSGRLFCRERGHQEENDVDEKGTNMPTQ
jgi:hypothetical protein